MIRDLAVDDQPLYREGLSVVLASDPALTVVGEAGDGAAALALCDQQRPDVVLMDLEMPEMNGVAATRALKLRHPDIKVLVLTTFDDDEHVFEALRAGAVGYLLKDSTAERLKEAVHAAARGQSFLAPAIASRVLLELQRLRDRPSSGPWADSPFTEREGQVLALLTRGASNKEIAAALFISEGTVKNHVTAVFAKLEVRDRTQAALRARALGFAS